MKGIALLIAILISAPAFSDDCFEMAGRDYKIDPDLLRAISSVESSFKVNATGKNPLKGHGVGLMQIDSQNFIYLRQFGITPDKLLSDSCLNIYTGTYYLAIAVNRWGMTWQAVGAYNAGFAKTHQQNLKRIHYARKVKSVYTVIKGKPSEGSPPD